MSEEIARTTISLPPALLADGVRRAKEENRSFSNHVAVLILKDVREAAEEAA